MECFDCFEMIAVPLVNNKMGNDVKSVQVAATDWQCQENYDRTDHGHYEFRTLHTTVTALLQQNGSQLHQLSFVILKWLWGKKKEKKKKLSSKEREKYVRAGVFKEA